MVRVQELQEQPNSKIDTARFNANISSEAVGLFSTAKQTNDAAQNNRAITNGKIDFSSTDIYKSPDSRFNKLPEKPNGACSLVKPDCVNGSKFRPDPELRTPQAREWNRQSQEQRRKPLDVDKDGNYQVKPGDSLWTIAERMGRGKDGQRRPSAKEITENIKRITEANPEIGCNPDYLRSGRKIRIPQEQAKTPAEANRPKPQPPEVKTPAEANKPRQQQPEVKTPAEANKPRQQQPEVKTPAEANAPRPQPPEVKTPAEANAPRPQPPEVKTPAEANAPRPQPPEVKTPAETNAPRPQDSSITSGGTNKPDACIKIEPAPMPILRGGSGNAVPMPELPPYKPNPNFGPVEMPRYEPKEPLCANGLMDALKKLK